MIEGLRRRTESRRWRVVVVINGRTMNMDQVFWIRKDRIWRNFTLPT